MRDNFEELAVFPGSELELIRNFMAGKGVAETKWLFGSGLAIQETTPPGHAISLKQFDAIYRNVYRLTNTPGVGIEFGLALNLSRWGMLSAALLCANTLGHALAIADEFKAILRSRFIMTTQQKGRRFLIKLRPNPDMNFPVNEIFAYEVFLGSLSTQISQLLAKPFRFSEVMLPYAKPLVTGHYRKITENPVIFGAPSAQVSLPLELLQTTLPMTNRVTRQIVISRCRHDLEQIRNARSGDVVFSVRSLLAQSEEKLPDLPTMASKLLISPRTLRRRLEQQQVQYRQLCEQERQQRAMSLLSTGKMSLKEISERCGFKDNASFHKAFKRWTGETPTSYRRQIQARD